MLSVLRTCPVPCIALAMGERGQISRLLAPKYGGFLTFGALSLERASGAPGGGGGLWVGALNAGGPDAPSRTRPALCCQVATCCSAGVCCISSTACCLSVCHAAPGQPTLQQLSGMYGLKRQRQDTAVMGIVGNPVSHRWEEAGGGRHGRQLLLHNHGGRNRLLTLQSHGSRDSCAVA